MGDARHLHKFPQFDTDPDAYYRPYPEFSRSRGDEPVHPQIVAENGPDSAHFQYVHGATVTPKLLEWNIVDKSGAFSLGGQTPAATIPTRWRCGSTAICSGSAAPSAHSKVRQTIG